MTEAGVDAENANGTSTGDDVYLACFAEAQFQLAWQAELVFFRAEMPRYEGPPSRSGYDRWAEEVLLPWVNYRMEHLNGTLATGFAHAVNAHQPRWEIAAVYALAHAFRRFACEIRSAPPPPDINPIALELLGHRAPRCHDAP